MSAQQRGGERDVVAGRTRDAAGQAGTATSEWGNDDHLIRGYN